MSDEAIRILSEDSRGYGVTLHRTETSVSASCHKPWVLCKTDAVTTQQMPAGQDFMLYYSAMQQVVESIDTVISDLTARRDALLAHMGLAAEIGAIPGTDPVMEE